jgi:hypothetical protein
MAWLLVAGGLTYVGTAAVTTSDKLTPASFSGYATGTALHVTGVQSLPDRIADVDLAFSAASAKSNGLNAAGAVVVNTANEFGVKIQPALIPLTGKTASGRGAGLELGLGVSPPVDPATRQLILTGIAEAVAPPNSALVTQNTVIPGDPVIYAALLEGQAQAKFGDLLDRCPTTPLANPFGFGRGFAADVQLVNAGGTTPAGAFAAPLVATDTNTVSVTETRSRVFPIFNGDGTFGLKAVIESEAVPIRLNLPPDDIEANDVVIDVGKASLTLTATGKPNGAKVEYSAPPTPNVIVGGTPVVVLPPIVIPIPGLLQVIIAQDPPRAIGGDNTSSPTPATNTTPNDGTTASAAVDGVRIGIPSALPLPVDPILVDLAVQHFEGSLKVPPGGFSFNDCGQLKVTKSVVGAATGPFKFHVDCPGVVLTPTEADFELADGASKIISVPSTKQCTVTETDAGTATATTGVPATVTIPRNMGVVEVNVTNLSEGILKVSKTAQSGLKGPFTFAAACVGPTGAAIPTTVVPASFTLNPNESRQFDHIPGGTTCTVTETDKGDSSVTRITDSTAPNDDGKVTIAGGDTQTVTFSNAGPPLVISKTATGESAGKGPFKFHLECKDPAGTAIALDAADADFTLNAGQDHPIKKDMADGSTCVVTEVDSGGATSVVPTDTSGASDDRTVTLKHGETQNVTFTNNFAPQIKLVVSKTVVGNGTGPFKFHLACTGVTLPAADADFSLNGGESRSFKSIPDGSTCTLTETDSRGATRTFAESSGTPNDGVVVIPTNGAAQVGVTNTFVTPATVQPRVIQPRTVG